MSIETILMAGLALLVGLVLGYLIRQLLVAQRAASIEATIRSKLSESEEKAHQTIIEAQKKAADILVEAKKEEKERKVEISNLENRLIQREELIDKKFSSLQEEESSLKKKQASLDESLKQAEAQRYEIEERLKKVSGLSPEKAKEMMMSQIKEHYQDEMIANAKKVLQDRQAEIDRLISEYITTSMQTYARSHVAEMTTTVFNLQSEEIKGKIIGREGRNIRTLERETGAEFIMDETPDTIVISSFDPFRREVARLALEKLIKDGRIQPAKIEEKVEEAKQELTKRIGEIGEEAAMEIGIYDLPKEILELLGRLHFRTSFGQNVLVHSLEMAHISAYLAAELGLDVSVAKKGALLHDIGKAIDHEVEGTHVELGRKLLKKYGIDERVIQAMQSHHDDYPYEIPEAFVVTTADILSAGRPGARRGTLENYVKRLADLEKIASEFPAVKSSYAISAGRELRVFVTPEKIDDFGALELAREIANRIQSELRYPGEIKVNVIRETRAVEFAR
ncbi:MAG: ribonuclease Y [Anaplasmataceae bacterium]|nr:ribonuclease Y [Anaplasmataceae bacterium]